LSSASKLPTIDESTDTGLLRAVVEHATDAGFLVDAAGRIRIFNQASETLFGYTSAEIVGQQVVTLMPARPRQALDGRLGKLTSTTHGRRKDGSTFPMESSVVRTERGGELILVRIIHDLAGRFVTGVPAPGHDQNYRKLVEHVSDYAIYMLDVSGNVSSWNLGACRIKQYSSEEIIGRHFRIFYAKAERDAGEPEKNLEFAQRTGRFEVNAWRERKDGSRFWANVVIEPLRNENGQLTGFAKVTSDITERREIERKIDEAGQRISAVIETVVDGFVQIDRHGKIQTLNPASLKLFGYRTDEAVGQGIGGLISWHGEHCFDEAEMRKLTGRSHEGEGQRSDGSVFPMAFSVGEASQDGEPVFVIIIHDLTEYRRTHEQLLQAQKMEIVGQLSGGIAHDFNNLLTVIMGNSEFLAEELEGRHDLKQLASDIGRAGERGAELTQRLLAFSRRQMLRPVAIDCNRLIESMQKLLLRALREDIEIKVDLDPGLTFALADAGQLESAVYNLAINAQDAMPSGGCLTLTTSHASLDRHSQSLHPDIPTGDYLVISVMDNGEGMSPEVKEHAFEPFYTTKEVGKGSGLGLSMVYGFVKQSNGHISIYSDPGLGTTVRLYLPQAGSNLPQANDESAVESGLLPRGTERILVVEDDPFVRSLTVRQLKSLDYEVLVAAGAEDALHKLRSDAKIDVLFTDIVMPGATNGWELAELAKRIRPRLPVLLTSGYALETLVKQGRLQQGAVVLAKPYRKETLALRLREILLVGSMLDPSPQQSNVAPTKINAAR
jgi:PAS domain S-box-containing protein